MTSRRKRTITQSLETNINMESIEFSVTQEETLPAPVEEFTPEESHTVTPPKRKERVINVARKAPVRSTRNAPRFSPTK